MRQDILLFAHLVLYLTGTLLYGFLARELFRNPRVLPGLPMRLLVLALTAWHGGCLADALGAILLPRAEEIGRIATALDLVRGTAWLLSFPLLSHGLWRLLAEETERVEGSGGRPGWGWIVPGYAMLPLFGPGAWRAWQESAVVLVEVGRSVYPLVVLHVAVSCAASAWLVGRILRLAEDARLRQFLRWLLAGLGVMLALIAAGAVLGPAAPGAERATLWGETFWRLAVEASGLVLGLTFLYFVLRYNLLRLSLSFRSLRRFASLVALAGLFLIAGSAFGAGGTPQLRRSLALGLLVALLAAVLATPLQSAALRRFAWLRRVLGVSIKAEELEGLSRRLQSLELSESEMRQLAAREIGHWLAAEARFLPPPSDPEEGSDGSPAALLWRHFRDPEARAFNRLDAPAGRLAAVLQRSDLQAAFPLRVGGGLAGVLVLEIGPAAGGYQEGDMETVQLVLRQLATALELRRLLDERLAAERRLAERERLSLLGLVAASLAHELKNPLSSMKALAQTVGEELAAEAPGSDRAEDLAVIVEQIDRLHAVAREILDFTRIPEGGDGTDLAALARGTLYVLGHQARRRGIELDGTEVAGVGRVGGTSATWQTVLFNLVLNASQHAPAGSTVRVRLAREGDGAVVFATENAGPPIPPEVAGRMFEPFVSDGNPGGTGLGLALVAQRVRDLGGEIAVVNEPGRIVFAVRVRERKEIAA